MENNKIDIKLFIPQTRFKFVGGLLKKVERQVEDKELEFYNLDEDLKNKILEKKDLAKKDDITFLYELIPVISNIDMTISIEEFKKLCKMPNAPFMSLINVTMDYLGELFVTMHEISDMEKILKTKLKDFK